MKWRRVFDSVYSFKVQGEEVEQRGPDEEDDADDLRQFVQASMVAALSLDEGESEVIDQGAPDLDHLIEGLYLEQFPLDRSYVMRVFDIAAQGDSEALQVMRWAGDQLGQLACGVIRQVRVQNEFFEVVQIGSIYNGHPLISEQMRETIHQTAPNAEIVRLTVPPVVGGVLLGMESDMGKSAYLRRQQVHKSIQGFQI